MSSISIKLIDFLRTSLLLNLYYPTTPKSILISSHVPLFLPEPTTNSTLVLNQLITRKCIKKYSIVRSKCSTHSIWTSHWSSKIKSIWYELWNRNSRCYSIKWNKVISKNWSERTNQWTANEPKTYLIKGSSLLMLIYLSKKTKSRMEVRICKRCMKSIWSSYTILTELNIWRIRNRLKWKTNLGTREVVGCVNRSRSCRYRLRVLTIWTIWLILWIDQHMIDQYLFIYLMYEYLMSE